MWGKNNFQIKDASEINIHPPDLLPEHLECLHLLMDAKKDYVAPQAVVSKSF